MDATDLDSFVNALIDDLAPSPPPEDDAERGLFHLLDCPRPVVDEHALVAALGAAVAVRNLADHVIAQACAAAERVGAPARRRLRSAADLLIGLGVAPGAAYRAVRVGRGAPTVAALTRQQRLGGVGIEFADAVGKGVAHVGARVVLSEQERAAIVTTLMIQSTPSTVTAKARAIAIAKASPPTPQRAVPVAEDADLNEMALIQNDDGRVGATLDLDVLTGEELFAALDPLCRPVPLPDGSPDPRSSGRRRADAFGQLVRTYLSNSRRPTSGGVLPHVSVIRPATALAPKGVFGEQAVDTLGFTGPITATTADLICCDSSVDTVLVDDHGAPLDVGRSQRLFPPAIRKALATRDRGCAFPGCGRPVSWCDAHHITPWGASGITSVDNGVLLCRCHHTLIHHSDWQVYLGPDRHPWFIAPHRDTGPQPPHLRSHARRTLTTMATAA